MPAVIQASFSKGEIAPAAYGRVDTAMYQAGLRTARNVIVQRFGGVVNRAGLEFIGPVKDFSYAPRLIGFEFKSSDTYLLEFGDFYVRVIRNGGYVLEAAKNITGITQANPPVLISNAHGYSNGDTVFAAAVVGMTQVNQRLFTVRNATANTFTLESVFTGTAINATTYSAYVSGGTVARVYTFASPYAIADVDTLKVLQSADTMTLTHPSYAPRELTRSGHASWTFSTPTFAPSIAAPTGVAVGAGGGAVSRNYAVTALKTDTSEESLPTVAATATGAATPADVISWAAVAGAAKYSIYLQSNGIYGWLGDTELLTFTNSNIAPGLTISPPKARNPFPGAGTFPAAAGYFDQRRVMGGTLNQPDTSFYSRVGSANNESSSSPPQDDDAITATLNSQKVNEIRHYVSGDDLLVFTSGSEWQVNSGSDTNFSAATLKQHPQSEWGTSHMAPIRIGKTVLYVTENQCTVRSIGFTWQLNGYTGEDVSLLSGHLFETYSITDSAFARYPDPIAHYVRQDGNAACMTFNQDQQMIAWTHWDTQGKFERVCAIRRETGRLDESVYFVVRRIINGRVVRYVERLHSRRFTDVRDCFFVDAGVSYNIPVAITGITLGATTTVASTGHGFSNGDEIDIFDVEWTPTFDDISGNETQPDQLNGGRYTVANATTNAFDLSGVISTGFAAYIEGGTARKAVSMVAGGEHLEGQGVSVLADGNALAGLTVTNGAITLPRKFSRIHYGLRYVADVETLDVETPGSGTVQGHLKKISTATIRFERSRGLLFGPSSDQLTEMKQREFEKLGEPTALLTGDKLVTFNPSWNTHGRVFLRQKYPLPMSILAVIPDISISP